MEITLNKIYENEIGTIVANKDFKVWTILFKEEKSPKNFKILLSELDKYVSELADQINEGDLRTQTLEAFKEAYEVEMFIFDDDVQFIIDNKPWDPVKSAIKEIEKQHPELAEVFEKLLEKE